MKLSLQPHTSECHRVHDDGCARQICFLVDIVPSFKNFFLLILMQDVCLYFAD